MKFLVINEIASATDEDRKGIMSLYAKHGVPEGTEALWVTADGQRVVQLLELDDLTDFSRIANLYAPAFSPGTSTWYPLVDAEVSIGHQAAGIEARLANS